MPKRQVSDARGIRKADRQREQHAKKEEKLAKRRERREQDAQADPKGKGAPPKQ